MDLCTEDKFADWKVQFEKKTKMTLRVLKTYPHVETKLSFKKDYRCCHNTRSKSSSADAKLSSKNTKCPMTLKVSISRLSESLPFFRGKSRVRQAETLPTKLTIKWTHNHPLIAAAVLKHRDVGEAAKQKLRELFEKRHSPSSALDLIRYDLQQEYGSDYAKINADRQICPDLDFCYRYFYKLFKTNYGDASGAAMISQVEEMVRECNTRGEKAKMEVKDNNMAIAFLTPLMYRLHTRIKHSGELMFIDSSGTVDRHNCRIFLLLKHCCAGGVPLGCLITTSGSTEVITMALQLYNSLLDQNCFFGRGQSGPQVIMTDDSTAERAALQQVFPGTTLILCAFHVLQAFWRFLWNAKNFAVKEHRPYFFQLMKGMLYEEDADELNNKYEEVLDDQIVKKYRNVLSHFKAVYEKKETWAMCFRQSLPIRGNNTNNFCEAAMKVMKDKIFLRLKAYNVQQLLDFLVTRMDMYYQHKLIDIANSRFDRVMHSRYFQSTSTIKAEAIVQRDAEHYSVPSESSDEMYEVDMDVGLCTCYIGVNGGPCKHQFIVMKKFGLTSWNFMPVNSMAMRQFIYQIASGQSNLPSEWFASLKGEMEGGAEMMDTRELQQPSPNENEVTDNNTGMEDESTERMEDESEDLSSMPTASASHALSTLSNKLDDIVKDLKFQLMENPEELTVPVEKFIKGYNSLTTASGLASDLSCFGKYSGAAKPLRAQNRLMGLKSIGVQPGSVARRKTLLGGRKRVGLGRPCKSANSIPKRSEILRSAVLPRRKAPHNLASCVKHNKQLGKTHHAK